jgi:mannose-1-phosphate guanylyltransferase
MMHVAHATQAVAQEPGRLVLLAIAPREADTDYGYIVPCQSGASACRFGTQPIRTFFEKPKAERAYQLIRTGALWNTMTMIFKLNTLLELVESVQPMIHRRFVHLLRAIDTAEERQAIESLYRELEPVNFSTGIMEPLAERHRQRLAVLPVRQVFWSDWGSPERIRQTLLELPQHQWPNSRFARPQPSGSTTRHQQSQRRLVAGAAAELK